MLNWHTGLHAGIGVSMNMRPIHDAAARGEYAVVLRLGRIGRGWTQAQLGERVNLSRTVVSRFETGDRPLRDVQVRRLFADALELPVELFGLSDPGGPKVGGTGSEGETDVRRRAFLLAAGAVVLPAGQAVAEVGSSPVQVLMDRVEQALIHPEYGRVLDPMVLPEMMRAARADYLGTRYLALADRLVNLVASAEALVYDRPEPKAHRVLADAYSAVGNFLCKLPASGLEWMATDRAVRAARAAEEPLAHAEAQRLLSTVCRRAGRPGQAVDICTSAAEQLRQAGGSDGAMRTAEILCTASYGAAKAGDRDRAVELLRDARQLAERARANGQAWNEFVGPVNVSVYAVSVGAALGDLGMSFSAMRQVTLGALGSAERRSRFLVDAATVRFAADQPEEAARTLLMAARVAPQAAATRPTAVKLAGELRRARPDLGRQLVAVRL